MTLKEYENTLHAVFNCDCSLSAIGRGVVSVIATVMFSKHTSNCKITIAEIAASVNVSPRTVKYAMRELKNKGVVSVTARDGGANVYKLNVRGCV